jgi:O-antigen ligase
VAASTRTQSPRRSGAIVLALALPLLFLHARYTPGLTLGVGSTNVDLELTDAALAAVALAGAHAWWARGMAGPASGRAVWIAAGALLALALASAAWGPLVTEGYSLADGLVSALKFAEYAVLAPAVVLLVRSRGELVLVLSSVVAWTALAAVVGVLQFLGLLGDLDNTPAGRRKPSFLGYHDFAALSAAAVAIAVVAFALGDSDRRGLVLARVAAVAGTVGMIVAGSIAAIGGLTVATGATLILLRARGRLHKRGALMALAVVAVAVAGTVAVRSADVSAFVRFLGLESRMEDRSDVQTYSHRTVLSYIGLRIAADRPLFGAGWQGSQLEASYGPYLDDARRRFPDVAEASLPSPEHPWGVQNAYVQAAADMGAVGFVALVALLAAAAATAARRALRGPPASSLISLAWLAVAAVELAALGLVPGAPIDALLWLAVGLAVASPTVAEDRTS